MSGRSSLPFIVDQVCENPDHSREMSVEEGLQTSGAGMEGCLGMQNMGMDK